MTACTSGELNVLLEFERWERDGVNTHAGLRRRVLASAVEKGLLEQVAPRDPDEAVRYILTAAGRAQIAAARAKHASALRPAAATEVLW